MHYAQFTGDSENWMGFRASWKWIFLLSLLGGLGVLAAGGLFASH